MTKSALPCLNPNFWTIALFFVSIVAALPQTNGVDEAVVIINRNIPLTFYFGANDRDWAVKPLDEATDVQTATFVTNLPGVGCFFTSGLSSSGSSDGSSLSSQPSKLVSKTFYSGVSASSGRLRPSSLTVPYAKAEYLTCFRLPDPTESNDQRMAVWLAPADLEAQAPGGFLKFVILRRDNNNALIGANGFDNVFKLNAAAIVHDQGPLSGCLALEEGKNPDPDNRFVSGLDLVEPLENFQDVFCYEDRGVFDERIGIVA